MSLTRKVSDVVIVGCGIAGSALAFELSTKRGLKVTVLDMEKQPGYHSTGRSAAVFSETYGPPGVRALTKASRKFFEECPGSIFPKVGHPILTNRGKLWIVSEQKEVKHGLEKLPQLRKISKEETVERCPVLRTDYVKHAFFEEDAMDIDVAALQSGYLSESKKTGTEYVYNAGLVNAVRNETWVVTDTQGETYEAKYLVNASGAWADTVSSIVQAGKNIKTFPRRRTMFSFHDDRYKDVNMSWPFVVDSSVAAHDSERSFYFKAQGPGTFIASPADATPSEACDAYAEDLTIAEGVERVLKATTLNITKLDGNWAGLRTFSEDGEFILGQNEHDTPNFFHITALAGYGVQTAPATADTVAELIVSGEIPKYVQDFGLKSEMISPKRFDS